MGPTLSVLWRCSFGGPSHLFPPAAFRLLIFTATLVVRPLVFKALMEVGERVEKNGNTASEKCHKAQSF